MRLPLRLLKGTAPQSVVVADAKNEVVSRFPPTAAHEKAAAGLVRRLNSDWRYVLFGLQPYDYTREDWLFEKNVKT